MISLSRVLLENPIRKLRMRCKSQLIWLSIFCCVFSVHSGIRIDNYFKDTTDNLNITFNNGPFSLKNNYSLIVKVYGDTIKNSAVNSNYPDVIAHAQDTFQFYYLSTTNALFNSSVRITPSSVIVQNPKKFVDIVPFSGIFLHADKGRDGVLLSYVQSSSTGAVLTAQNGNTSLNIDNSDIYDYIASSQCYLGADTFIIANSIEANELKLRKIYSSGSNITVVKEIQIEKDPVPAQRHLTNCAVGYDNNDVILVVWSRGPPNLPRQMHYKFYSRAFNEIAYGVLDSLACDNGFYHYDDFAIVSNSSGKFSIVFWNSSGVHLCQLSLNGGLVQETYKPIFQNAGLKHCAAATNGNKLAIITNGDVDGDGVPGIEGGIFDFNNGVLSTGKIIRFSDLQSKSAKILNNNSTAINCALDDNGSIAVTWRDSMIVQACIWANRGVKYQKGYWTSDVIKFPSSANDSIRIYPLQVFKSNWNQNNWYLEDSIRVGNTINQCLNSSWMSFSTDTIVTTGSYFQYRIAVNRKPGSDSLLTPMIDSAIVSWNVKPSFNKIDSVKISNLINKNIHFDDTITILSRSDTARVFLSVSDPDQNDIIRVQGASPAQTTVKTISAGPVYSTSVDILPVLKSDTVLSCTFSAWDQKGWRAVPAQVAVKTRNASPVINASIVISDTASNVDTLRLPINKTITIQETDSIEFIYSISDSNDPTQAKAYLSQQHSDRVEKLDSVACGVQKRSKLFAKNFSDADTMVFLLSGVDEDTSVVIPTRVIINHAPQIVLCQINSDTINKGDTIRVILGKANLIRITVGDTDCHSWDSLHFRFTVRDIEDRLASKSVTAQYSYFPQKTDSTMKITVTDRWGKKDSISFFIKYPWLETDTSLNQEHAKAIELLAHAPSLIIGNGMADTFELPFLNNGSDSMYFHGIRFSTNSHNWLSVTTSRDQGTKRYNSNDYSDFEPLLLKPESTLVFFFVFNDLQLAGDSVVYDTVVFLTSDPLHSQISVPVRMEYNDLPKLIDVQPWFADGVPYTGLAKKRNYVPYRFPPHASFSISFSEPMDSVSAHKGIKVYSVLDSIVNMRPEPIDLQFSWSQNYTKVNVRPSYKRQSSHFNILPPDGLFIPTDSLALVISVDLTDKARTPSGPNRLDVNLDYSRDTLGDTSFTMTVDSITFSLLSITPEPNDTSLEVSPEIELLFNAAVYAASVDTSLVNNRSLQVYSKYNNGKVIPFDSIGIDSNRIRFKLGQKLFYGDSVWCRFKSASVKDMMGFPTDNDFDGIAMPLYDTASILDDINWSYRVKTIKVISVSPDSGQSIVDVSPSIRIEFSDPIVPGVIDTSLKQNISLYVKPRFSSETTEFSKIELSSDNRSVVFQPKVKYFSNDSIHCYFRGFSMNHRYSQQINLPLNIDSVFGEYDWFFKTGKIGFYTYPNPYKPGKERLHCKQNGPCGIWFKNLHALREGISDVKIKIFTMNAHPVYDSQKDRQVIHFKTSDTSEKPEWLWDTRNQSGELVASGLYVYIIYDLEGNVLLKGKLIIVR